MWQYSISQPYVWHDSFICMWHDSIIFVITWLIHSCVTWPIHLSFIYLRWVHIMCRSAHTNIPLRTWFSPHRVMTHSYVWHDQFMCVTWPTHIRDMNVTWFNLPNRGEYKSCVDQAYEWMWHDSIWMWHDSICLPEVSTNRAWITATHYY